jgi:glyoxylase-like metal-dependent hydrolase (beta-lactamase superfamily II)
VTIDVLLDAEGSFATVGEAFPASDSDAPWVLPFNCVLVRTDDATALIDTGIGPKPRAFVPEPEGRLLHELARHGVVPEDVDVVVHTHLHVDHVGWDGSFPNARYVVHEDDWAFFMSAESLAARAHLREKVEPLANVERVTGETEVVPGVELVPTPGHTPGHMSVRIGSTVVLGDVVVHELQVADPDLVYVSDHDAAGSAETRRRVLGELADEGADVIVSTSTTAVASSARARGFAGLSNRGACRSGSASSSSVS